VVQRGFPTMGRGEEKGKGGKGSKDPRFKESGGEKIGKPKKRRGGGEPGKQTKSGDGKKKAKKPWKATHKDPHGEGSVLETLKKGVMGEEKECGRRGVPRAL